MKTRTLALAAPLLAVAGLAAPASAAVMQAPGANFVAFEAENFDVEDGADTAEPFWQTIADPNASGGQTLFANDPGDFTNGQPGNNEFVGYTITFTQTGDYQLYVRRLAERGGNNSFFVADSFAVSPTSASFPQFDNIDTDPNYVYRSGLGGNPDNDKFYAATAGQTVTFYVKPREPNYRLDRIVLSRDTDLSGEQLAALANSPAPGVVPEPASAAAVVAGLGAIALRRRR